MLTYMRYLVIACCMYIFFTSFPSCTKNNCPFESETEANNENQYIESWADTLSATGVGAPNPNVPLAAQRASAISAAKTDLLRNLLELTEALPVSSTQTVEDLLIDNDLLHTQIDEYLKDFSIYDTTYLSTGDIEVLGGVLSDGLKEIIEPCLEDLECSCNK